MSTCANDDLLGCAPSKKPVTRAENPATVWFEDSGFSAQSCSFNLYSQQTIRDEAIKGQNSFMTLQCEEEAASRGEMDDREEFSL